MKTKIKKEWDNENGPDASASRGGLSRAPTEDRFKNNPVLAKAAKIRSAVDGGGDGSDDGSDNVWDSDDEGGSGTKTAEGFDVDSGIDTEDPLEVSFRF